MINQQKSKEANILQNESRTKDNSVKTSTRQRKKNKKLFEKQCDITDSVGCYYDDLLVSNQSWQDLASINKKLESDGLIISKAMSSLDKISKKLNFMKTPELILIDHKLVNLFRAGKYITSDLISSDSKEIINSLIHSRIILGYCDEYALLSRKKITTDNFNIRIRYKIDRLRENLVYPEYGGWSINVDIYDLKCANDTIYLNLAILMVNYKIIQDKYYLKNLNFILDLCNQFSLLVSNIKSTQTIYKIDMLLNKCKKMFHAALLFRKIIINNAYIIWEYNFTDDYPWMQDELKPYEKIQTQLIKEISELEDLLILKLKKMIRQNTTSIITFYTNENITEIVTSALFGRIEEDAFPSIFE